MYAELNQVVYSKVTKTFYKVESISNQGTYKLRELYSNRYIWSSYLDSSLIPEEEATLRED